MAKAQSQSLPATPSEAYWTRLAQGHFEFQLCGTCGHKWLPPRSECPKCWSAKWSWQEASGKGRLVSWVIFHTAFDAAFEGRLPYNVAIVELAEGPRLITNITNLSEHQGDVIDRATALVIEADHSRSLPRFRIV